jgi:ferrochelatase
MRYGSPAVGKVLDELKNEGVTRVLVPCLLILSIQPLPRPACLMRFTPGSAHPSCPELRFVNNYHDHPAYIAALADSIQRHWQTDGRHELLVMSFHGVPERTLKLGDPYHCECHKTARLLALALGLTQRTI